MAPDIYASPPTTRRATGALRARAPWTWAVIGLLAGLIVSVLLFAPARWLASGIAAVTGSRVVLSSPSGSLWTGSAQMILSAGQGSQSHTALPGRLHWTVRLGWSGLELSLGAACCLPQNWVWTITPGLAGLQLRAQDIPQAQASQWPSALLEGLGTPWNTLQLTGTLAMSTKDFGVLLQTNGVQVSGYAQLDASNMSTSLSTIKPLGSYRMALTGGESATLVLSTLEGSLQLSGTGQWVGGTLWFDGQATAEPERAEALANLLNIIGRRDGARSIIKVG